MEVTTNAAMAEHKSIGEVFYDADCPFCTRSARRFENVLARRGFTLVPLQTPGAAETLGVSGTDLLAEMRLRLRAGATDGGSGNLRLGGAPAIAEIARHIWWAWPLWAVSRLPGAMSVMSAGYRWIARQRSCAGGVCETAKPAHLSPLAFFPLVALPIIALMFASTLPRWVFMWTLAFGLYAGCKWLTYREARLAAAASNNLPPAWRRTLGYLFAWPGMDAAAFLSAANKERPAGTFEWPMAVGKTLFGATLLIIMARGNLPMDPLLRGWLGMVGAIFVLHFGSFHLLSLIWRYAGVNAMPIMKNPARSRSLAEFWGRRWNTAFHELALRFTFQPLRAIAGSKGAALLVFLASGLVHELVISVPAGGGYGLPTVYFLMQGAGVALERSVYGRQAGLGAGVRGRLFALAVAAFPAFWLFPPPFIHNIILPMLQTIGDGLERMI